MSRTSCLITSLTCYESFNWYFGLSNREQMEDEICYNVIFLYYPIPHMACKGQVGWKLADMLNLKYHLGIHLLHAIHDCKVSVYELVITPFQQVVLLAFCSCRYSSVACNPWYFIMNSDSMWEIWNKRKCIYDMVNARHTFIGVKKNRRDICPMRNDIQY